ncbi:MAG: BMP family ABC transporter substrate-binding protein [Actinomycetales bacterium]|nr:BMP family ABC transporter substrate-binding protein [Actinomycetales bacterium]
MRHSIKATALLAAVALGLAACSSGSSTTTTTTTAPAAGGATTVKVGMAFDTGGRGDGTFNDLAVKGLERAAKELGVTAKELSPNADGTNRADLLRQLADSAYNPIIGVGYAYGDPMDQVAKEYPKVQFVRIDGGPSTVANVAVMDFAEQEGSFLVGVAAALKSKTKKVGFIGGNESMVINKFGAGFVQGVKAVDPAIVVADKRLASGDEGKGFGDTQGAKVAAAGMYQDGADIVFTAAGGSFAGSFPAAKDAGKLVIGVDSDQYNTVSDATWKPLVLTSMVKRVDNAVFQSIQSFRSGGALKSHSFNLKDDGVGYSQSGGFVDDIKTQLEDYKSKIVSGAIKVNEK